MPPNEVTVGLDLAQASDYTALAVLERRGDLPGAPFDVVELQRWNGEPYTGVPERVRAVQRAVRRAAQAALWAREGRDVPLGELPEPALVVDATGVGAAVVDLLRDAGLEPVPVVIHGGDAVGVGDRGGWRAPKRDLVSAVQVALQQRRLRISRGLPDAETLAAELAAFRVRLTAAGHDVYGAGGGETEWRGRPHDDLVLALALAVWHAERVGRGRSALEVFARSTRWVAGT